MRSVTKVSEGCFIEMSRVPVVIWHPLIGPSRSQFAGFYKVCLLAYVLQLRSELLGPRIYWSQVPLCCYYLVDIYQERFLLDHSRLWTLDE